MHGTIASSSGAREDFRFELGLSKTHGILQGIQEQGTAVGLALPDFKKARACLTVTKSLRRDTALLGFTSEVFRGKLPQKKRSIEHWRVYQNVTDIVHWLRIFLMTPSNSRMYIALAMMGVYW